MKVIKSQSELREELAKSRESGKSVGFVPTMGGLHAGHMSLVERSMKENDLTVVSVFLNPTQFNDPSDLETYPHDTEEDIRLLESASVQILFLPSVEEMYPEGEEAPQYDLGRVAEVMEGEHRPGHFRGVVWIVSKLFRLVEPTRAYFGMKDFQQIAVVKRMVELSPDMNVEIVPCDVVREADGLAMSSRNNRLTPAQRQVAPRIYRALNHGQQLMKGGDTVSAVKTRVTQEINSSAPLRVEYFSIVDGDTLEEVTEWGDNTVGCITVFCGDVRLIDHITFNKP
ncbi:MAG: pantoate--beta-alanine ligase [Porphyromonas sp.]|nr:pantoate--beta-alanine ligase [Porphyromonas sp.]